MCSSFVIQRGSVSFFERDKHSFDFSLTRIFLFRTGWSAVVTECQKQFCFLPLKFQVDIRTASFMMRFRASENSLCSLFADQAARTLSVINDRYGNSRESINSVKDAVQRKFHGWKHCYSMFAITCWIVYIICSVDVIFFNLSYTWRIKDEYWSCLQLYNPEYYATAHVSLTCKLPTM